MLFSRPMLSLSFAADQSEKKEKQEKQEIMIFDEESNLGIENISLVKLRRKQISVKKQTQDNCPL